nr:uncharacterized protein LOC107431586 [Ziziphus jujuba var. spinosa]
MVGTDAMSTQPLFAIFPQTYPHSRYVFLGKITNQPQQGKDGGITSQVFKKTGNTVKTSIPYDMIEELINKGYERRNNAATMQTLVTNWLENIMQECSNNAKGLRVIPLNLYEFQIFGYGMFVGVVNLENKTCSCKEFDIDGFPCVHAIEACKH